LRRGAMVSDVVRRADISSGQIYRWRQELRATPVSGFTPVLIATESPVTNTEDDRRGRRLRNLAGSSTAVIAHGHHWTPRARSLSGGKSHRHAECPTTSDAVCRSRVTRACNIAAATGSSIGCPAVSSRIRASYRPLLTRPTLRTDECFIRARVGSQSA